MTEPAGLVWLASFPKSGNTWFRIFLTNLMARQDGPADINDLDERLSLASSRDIFEAVTMLDSSLMRHDESDCLRPRVYEVLAAEAIEQIWVKVHDAYTLTRAGEPLLGRGVARAAIYIVRDPRDVAVSFANHNSTTIDEAIDQMNAENGSMCGRTDRQSQQLRQKLLGWSRHVSGWLDQTDVPVHLVRYEDLMADPQAGFGAALSFAGRSATLPEIERAVRYASFSELRRQEQEKGFKESISRTAPFFRSGRVGGWRHELTAQQALRIEQAHAAMMRRLGYELSTEEDLLTCRNDACLTAK